MNLLPLLVYILRSIDFIDSIYKRCVLKLQNKIQILTKHLPYL